LFFCPSRKEGQKHHAAKGGKEKPGVKPEISITTHHKKSGIWKFSRIAGFLFLSFFRKLRKRKENPINPVNPVG
jgi:hypothetical protein